MLIYLFIIGFLIFLTRKFNNLFVLITGIILILLYGSPVITEFFASMINIINFNNLFIHNRILILLILLAIYLLFQVYFAIGLSVKAQNYINQPLNLKNNIVSICLSPFSEILKITKNEYNNPFYLFNRLTLPIIFPGSLIFVIAYFLISQYLNSDQTLFVIYGANIFLFLIIIANIIGLLTNFKTKNTNEAPRATFIYFNRFKKFSLINFIIFIITFIFSILITKHLLISILVALVSVLIFSIVYVDFYYFKTNEQHEWSFLLQLLNGFSYWFKVMIFVITVAIFVNVVDMTFANNWNISYTNINSYFYTVFAINIICNLFSKSKLLPFIFTMPLLSPIMLLVTPAESFLYLGMFLSLSLTVGFLTNQKFKLLSKEQFIGLLIIAIFIFFISVSLLILRSLFIACILIIAFIFIYIAYLFLLKKYYD